MAEMQVDLTDLKKFIAQLRNNYPQLGSDRFFVGDSDDLAAGTQLTVTFTLNPQWITHLLEAYCDDRADTAYRWYLDGKFYSLNQVSFVNGKIVSGEQVSTIVLLIANIGSSTQNYAYYIKGWGDRREGL